MTGPDLMGVAISIQFESVEPSVPTENEILHWARPALNGKEGEVTLRITDEDEMQSLNYKWRDIDCPTNVLSFPLHETGAPLFGDVVICAPVLRREAVQQDKSLDAHWAHMIIHGILHLIGYDHGNEKEAATMEATETAILKSMGFPDPYLPSPHFSPGDAKITQDFSRQRVPATESVSGYTVEGARARWREKDQ